MTGEGMAAFRASLEPIAEKMTPEQREAFEWAVSDFDLERLHREYPNKSAREIISGEVQMVLETYPRRIAELEPRAAELRRVREALGRVEAKDARFLIDTDTFGFQPKIRATILNGSDLPISTLDWHAALFIDGKSEPVATSVLTSSFRSEGGLSPGDERTVTFKIGFVSGDRKWTTLEIRNATDTRVVLKPDIESVRDFGDRRYIDSDVETQILRLQEAIQAARKYQQI
ncbi:MAG TPA: hypothetical protein VF339_14980 [Gammaproteobacteria bacterium]